MQYILILSLCFLLIIIIDKKNTSYSDAFGNQFTKPIPKNYSEEQDKIFKEVWEGEEFKGTSPEKAVEIAYKLAGSLDPKQYGMKRSKI